MGRRHDTISFLSDYGLTDEFVGVVHGVIAEIAPQARVIDLTHGIAAHDVRAGGLALARAVPYLPAGVVLGVVDPGVGTSRRAIAVEVGAEGEGVFVGPDNGLLAAAVAMAGGAHRAVELTAVEYQLQAPGATFAGRDVFAPAAAHLCNGVDLEALGRPIEPASLTPGLLPVADVEPGRAEVEVLWVDRFGNLQLNVDPDEILEIGDRVVVSWSDQTRVAVRAASYDELPRGQLGLVVDGSGLWSLVLARASAADELSLGPGSAVVLSEPSGS